MMSSSLFYLVWGSEPRQLRTALTFLMLNSRSIRRSNKIRCTKSQQYRTMLTQEGGLKRTKRTGGTTGGDWKDGSNDAGKRARNLTGGKKKKNHVLRFKEPKNREEQEPFNGELSSQLFTSLNPFDIEKMAQPEPVIEEHHRREAALRDVLRKGRPQKLSSKLKAQVVLETFVKTTCRRNGYK